MIVVDASVLVSALADDGDYGVGARSRLVGERLAAPELIDIEVAAAFRKLCSASKLTPQRAHHALSDLRDLRLGRVPHRNLIGRCWQLRHNLTIYDASYIAVAELFGAVLLTADSRLAKAPGARCKIEVLASLL